MWYMYGEVGVTEGVYGQIKVWMVSMVDEM